MAAEVSMSDTFLGMDDCLLGISGVRCSAVFFCWMAFLLLLLLPEEETTDDDDDDDGEEADVLVSSCSRSACDVLMDASF